MENTMTLDTGEHFTLNVQEQDSLFKGVNIFLRNNGENIVKVSTDGATITISVEKR